jgi:hypothetical protein
MEQPLAEAFSAVALVHVGGEEAAVWIRMEHPMFCIVEFLEDCGRLSVRRGQAEMIARSVIKPLH